MKDTRGVLAPLSMSAESLREARIGIPLPFCNTPTADLWGAQPRIRTIGFG